MTLYKDMQYHPAFTNKPVRLGLTDDSKVLITYDTGEVYPYDLSVEMNTDEASLLHYLLTQFLFDDLVLNQGMPKDYYGSEEDTI